MVDEPQIPAGRMIDHQHLRPTVRDGDRCLHQIVFADGLLGLRRYGDGQQTGARLLRVPLEDDLLPSLLELHSSRLEHLTTRRPQFHRHFAARQARRLQRGVDRDGVIEGDDRCSQHVGDGQIDGGIDRSDRHRDHRGPRLAARCLRRATHRIERVDADRGTAIGDQHDAREPAARRIVHRHLHRCTERRVERVERRLCRGSACWHDGIRHAAHPTGHLVAPQVELVGELTQRGVGLRGQHRTNEFAT